MELHKPDIHISRNISRRGRRASQAAGGGLPVSALNFAKESLRALFLLPSLQKVYEKFPSRNVNYT